MKIKSILAGVLGLTFAATAVMASLSDLQSTDVAFIHPITGVCTAAVEEGCFTTPTEDPCTIEVMNNSVQLLENNGTPQAPVCGAPLYRIFQ